MRSLARRPARMFALILVLVLVNIASSCAWLKNIFHSKSEHKSTTSVVLIPTDTTGRIPADNAKMELGAGFDSVAAEVREHCVDLSHSQLSPETGAGKQGYSLDTVSDLNTLSEKFHLTAAASFGVGVYSGDASFSYMKSGQFSQYYEVLVLSQRIENERRLYDFTKIHLTGEANRLLKSKGIAEFRRKCGDQFFIGEITGGSLAAMLRIDSRSAAEQEQTHVAFSGSGPNANVSVDASKSLETFRKTQQLHVDIVRQGPVESWPDATVAELIEYARTFPCKVAARKCTDDEYAKLEQSDSSTTSSSPKKIKAPDPHPYTIDFVAMSYDGLIDDTTLSDRQRKFFDDEALYAHSLYARRAGLQYMQSNPSQFGPYSSTHLLKEVSDLSNEISRVKDIVAKCGKSESSCEDKNQVSMPVLPPKLANDQGGWQGIDVTLNTGKNYGGSYGEDVKALEISGQWYPHCPRKSDANSNYVVTFVDHKSALRTEIPYPGVPVLIPPNHDVFVRAADGPLNKPDVWLDNCPVEAVTDKTLATTTGSKLRIYVPLYPEELRKVDTTHATL
jgi:hypothetical protein